MFDGRQLLTQFDECELENSRMGMVVLMFKPNLLSGHDGMRRNLSRSFHQAFCRFDLLCRHALVV